MKCANCDNAAVYNVADPGVNPVDYCNNCLPKHLADRARAGQFKTYTEKAEKAEKKSTKAAPVETPAEAPAEEPAAEPAAE